MNCSRVHISYKTHTIGSAHVGRCLWIYWGANEQSLNIWAGSWLLTSAVRWICSGQVWNSNIWRGGHLITKRGWERWRRGTGSGTRSRWIKLIGSEGPLTSLWEGSVHRGVLKWMESFRNWAVEFEGCGLLLSTGGNECMDAWRERHAVKTDFLVIFLAFNWFCPQSILMGFLLGV